MFEFQPVFKDQKSLFLEIRFVLLEVCIPILVDLSCQLGISCILSLEFGIAEPHFDMLRPL